MSADNSGNALVDRLRYGCALHPKRWCGDTHADLGGTVDEAATDAVMMQAANHIERLERVLSDIKVITETVSAEPPWLLPNLINSVLATVKVASTDASDA